MLRNKRSIEQLFVIHEVAVYSIFTTKERAKERHRKQTKLAAVKANWLQPLFVLHRHYRRNKEAGVSFTEAKIFCFLTLNTL